MKRYLIEYKHGNCITKEFNWSLTKDSNKPYAFSHIDDAEREMDEMNRLTSHYEKQLVYQV